MSKEKRPIAVRGDWETIEMPEKNASFVLSREFTAEQIAALRRGNVPQEMEDKWFWFMEGDTLYAHRSWTGLCVYRIDFSFSDHRHKVTVNRDPEQLRITSEEESRRNLNDLLDWWSKPNYDHYGEWIFETVSALKQAGKIPMNAEDYRKEGLALEQQEKYEEAFLKYEEAAKMDDTPSMIRIAGMYLSGKLRPVKTSSLLELLRGGSIFPRSLRGKEKPDHKSGLAWLMKAADLGDGLACETVGKMLCNGTGCKADVKKGVAYLEKAVACGQESAWKFLFLYRLDGKALTDAEYEICLTEFARAAEARDETANALYAVLKSGTQKQLARLGHVLIAAQNVQKSGFEAFEYAATPSGLPLLPATSKRWSIGTFLRFDLNAWAEAQPLIALSSDILSVNEPAWLLSHFHHARIVGTAKYRSPGFDWLDEEKEAVLIRLGEKDALSGEKLKKVAASFQLTEEEYQGESVAFLVEVGEKEYSFEIAGIKDEKVEVLWRYSDGGFQVPKVKSFFEPQLISMNMD